MHLETLQTAGKRRETVVYVIPDGRERAHQAREDVGIASIPPRPSVNTRRPRSSTALSRLRTCVPRPCDRRPTRRGRRRRRPTTFIFVENAPVSWLFDDLRQTPRKRSAWQRQTCASWENCCLRGRGPASSGMRDFLSQRPGLGGTLGWHFYDVRSRRRARWFRGPPRLRSATRHAESRGVAQRSRATLVSVGTIRFHRLPSTRTTPPARRRRLPTSLNFDEIRPVSLHFSTNRRRSRWGRWSARGHTPRLGE